MYGFYQIAANPGHSVAELMSILEDWVKIGIRITG
jgi:hypothetical protein